MGIVLLFISVMFLFLSFMIIEKRFHRFLDYEEITNIIGFDDNKWSKKGIEKSLKGFVEADELEVVSKAIFDFINDAKNHFNESATTYDCDFNPISKFIVGNSNRYVDIPQADIDYVEGSFFGFVGHSHPKSKIPLPDWYDMEVGIINLNVKYNMIYAPGFGVTLIKKSKPLIKPNKKSFKESYDVLNDRRRDYVNNIIACSIEEYKYKTKQNFYMSPVQKRKDRNKIRDKIRHSNLKQQCEFYNDELKKYGIFLTYIHP